MGVLFLRCHVGNAGIALLQRPMWHLHCLVDVGHKHGLLYVQAGTGDMQSIYLCWQHQCILGLGVGAEHAKMACHRHTNGAEQMVHR